MVSFRILILFCIAVLCWSAAESCRGGPADKGDYTEKEVAEFLKIGLAREAISARFGEPISASKTDEGGEVLIYHRPFSERTTAPTPGVYYFTGFSVYLRDNKLVKWEPITGNMSDPGELKRKPKGVRAYY